MKNKRSYKMSSKENNTFSANFGSRVSGTVEEPTTFNLIAPTITGTNRKRE